MDESKASGDDLSPHPSYAVDAEMSFASSLSARNSLNEPGDGEVTQRRNADIIEGATKLFQGGLPWIQALQTMQKQILGNMGGGSRVGIEKQSLVTWQSLTGWTEGGKARWDLRLPAGEKARAVAAGREWVAVATSRRQLRICRTSGLQEAVFLLPGPVVTMAARGCLLLVVTAAGPPTPQGQPLQWQVWVCPDSRASAIGSASGVGSGTLGSAALAGIGGVPGRGGVAAAGASASGLGMGTTPRLVQSGPLPQRPGETLTWAGVTEDGLAVVCDSAGLISALSPGAGWAWTVLSDLSADGVAPESSGQRAWIVDVARGKMVYALVRATSRAPAVLPRPVLSTHTLRVPLCGPRPDAAARKAAADAAASSSTAASEGSVAAPIWAPEAELLVSRVRADARRWALGSGIPIDLAEPSAAAAAAGETDAPGGDVSMVGPRSVGMAASRSAFKELVATERALDTVVLRLIHGLLTNAAAGGVGTRSKGTADARALHLGSRLVLPKSMDVAVHIAQKAGRAALAERLHSLRRARAAEREALEAASDMHSRAEQATSAAEEAVARAEASAKTAESAQASAAAKVNRLQDEVIERCKQSETKAAKAMARAKAALEMATQATQSLGQAAVQLQDDSTPKQSKRRREPPMHQDDSGGEDQDDDGQEGRHLASSAATAASGSSSSSSSASSNPAGMADTPVTAEAARTKPRRAQPSDKRFAKRVAFAESGRKPNPFARKEAQSPARKAKGAFASLVSASPDRRKGASSARAAVASSASAVPPSPARLTRESTVSREARGQRAQRLADLS
jgi:hypothetical protein